MMLALDHIVIGAKNPEQAAKDFSSKYHVEIVPGGEHKNWGTHNYLAYFANDCYIEWLGVFDKKLAEKANNPLIVQLVQELEQDKEGVVQIAFRTNDMEDFHAYFQQTSIPAIGPIPGRREKPDGTPLAWKMLFPQADDPMPFLIEWEKGYEKSHPTSFLNEQIIEQVNINLTNQLLSTYYKLPAKSKLSLANTTLYIEESHSTWSFTLH